MNCKIQWKNYTRDEWTALLNQCNRSTLLQCYYYAQAVREVSQQSSRHGLIVIDGVEAGIVQMQEVSLLKGLVHGMSIDRGPLWFKGFGKPSHLNAFSQTLNWKFPSRWGRKRRFMPEIYDKKHLILFNNWVKSNKSKPYNTYLVDLSLDLEKIRSNFNKNWRNVLNKAQKKNLNLQKDTELSSLSLLLNNYIKDRLEKKYAGASPKFIASLCKYAAMHNDCFILNASEDGETIASVLIFIHGNSATYQMGWTTPYGRAMGANNLLLWESIKILKTHGVIEFDLGGYNEKTEGIRKFKEGLGGHPVALIGSYS